MKQFFSGHLWMRWCVLGIVMWFCAVSTGMAASQADQQTDQTAGQTENTLEPEALEALNTMSNFLRTLNVFRVNSNFYRDEVLYSGQKILVSGTSSLIAKLPNKLFTQVKVDEKQMDFNMYFDGQKLTLYGKNNKFYVSVSAPGTLKDLVLNTFAEKGIELPLQDLFLWGTDASSKDTITSAVTIAEATLDGKPCTHYAYRQEDVDWQIWIQEGDKPLPLQLVITTTSETSQPQYSARLDWDLNPDILDATFMFVPPEDAHAIDFMPSSDDNEKN